MLLVPRRAPFDLFGSEKERNDIRLYMCHVFIEDDCDELMPGWLSMARGVVTPETCR